MASGPHHREVAVGPRIRAFVRAAAGRRQPLRARRGPAGSRPCQRFTPKTTSSSRLATTSTRRTPTPTPCCATSASAPQDDDRPFFAYLPFQAPHWPLQAPDESDRDLSRPLRRRPGRVARGALGGAQAARPMPARCRAAPGRGRRRPGVGRHDRRGARAFRPAAWRSTPRWWTGWTGTSAG